MVWIFTIDDGWAGALTKNNRLKFFALCWWFEAPVSILNLQLDKELKVEHIRSRFAK